MFAEQSLLAQLGYSTFSPSRYSYTAYFSCLLMVVQSSLHASRFPMTPHTASLPNCVSLPYTTPDVHRPKACLICWVSISCLPAGDRMLHKLPAHSLWSALPAPQQFLQPLNTSFMSPWVSLSYTQAGCPRILILPASSMWATLPCTPTDFHSPLTLPTCSSGSATSLLRLPLN